MRFERCANYCAGAMNLDASDVDGLGFQCHSRVAANQRIVDLDNSAATILSERVVSLAVTLDELLASSQTFMKKVSIHV